MPYSHEECAPRPAAMISSLRAFGYDLSMAIADLIDNSIFAKARNIRIDYDWNNGAPWIRILDDGSGMTETNLREAMRLGSQSPLEVRDTEDLGRFGLGLKTASFSQCKLLTVYSKTEPAQSAARSWDLDHVCESGKWEIGMSAPDVSKPIISILDQQEHGTVVLCQKLDRLTHLAEGGDQNSREVFLNGFEKVAHYLEMVFHRFLSGRDRINITVGRHQCKAWNPFFVSNDFTQRMSLEYLDDHRIKVEPFILPHVSKRTGDETARGSGLYGWNAHQGFYIYRNRRMIIAGGYLDLPFTAEEHYKLCRISLDLPNNLDHEWSIDVRKAAASPPSNVRNDIERIARAARSQAAEVYRARAGSTRKATRATEKHDVWLKRRRGEKVVYLINRKNEAIKRILLQIEPPKPWIRQLFHLIEKTVPHRLILIDNADYEDCQVDLPPEFQPPPRELIELCRLIFKEKMLERSDPHETAEYVCSFFDDHLAYRAALDSLIEETV